MNPIVSITMVTCNKSTWAQWCLNSILDYADVPFDIKIVDNGSTDDWTQVLDRIDSIREAAKQNPHFCGLEVIRFKENKYICHATNAGFKDRKGQYFCFIPSDTVMTEGFLSTLLKEMEHHGLDGISPRWFEPKQMVDQTGRPQQLDLEDPSGSATQWADWFRQGMVPYSNAREELERGWMVGIFWMTKRAVWEKVGEWDENFQLTCMDNDFCWRVMIAGFQIGIVNTVWVFHVGPATRMDDLQNPNWRKIGDHDWQVVFQDKWGTNPDDIKFLYKLIVEGQVRKKTLEDGKDEGIPEDIKNRRITA